MQLIRAMASWPTEVEVKGAPQIKCHTRRSVGPSCGTQIRPEEKSESDTFLRHETQLKKLLHLQGLNFVLFCSSAPFDVLSFDVKFFFFFLLQRCLSSPLDSKDWSFSLPFLWPELFLIVPVTGALSYTGLPLPTLRRRGRNCIKAWLRWTHRHWIKVLFSAW